jgi:hypothetical protein
LTLATSPQAMPDTIAPAIPPLPEPLPDREATPAEIDAWWRQYDIYLRAVGEVNRVAAIAASDKHAQAQADTAVAMTRAAEAQDRMREAYLQPLPAPTRQALVLEFMRVCPMRATDTPNTWLDSVAALVDQYLKEHGAA